MTFDLPAEETEIGGAPPGSARAMELSMVSVFHRPESREGFAWLAQHITLLGIPTDIKGGSQARLPKLITKRRSNLRQSRVQGRRPLDAMP